jgi:hypothetical protein
MSSFSSAEKILGISPEFSKLLMSSKNDSSLICQTVKHFMQHHVIHTYILCKSYNNAESIHA